MLGPDSIPTNEQWNSFSAADSLLMVGYPIGLADNVNNMPVFRRGIAATQPWLDYEGKKEFLVDMACFPGSSGSPVLYFDHGINLAAGGGFTFTGGGPRMALLGIQYAAPVYTERGQIVVQPIPTRQDVFALTQMSIHLGHVIKSTCLLEFVPLLEARRESH
jgi:hypothetical protein